VNKASNAGWTPLYMASQNGHLEAVRALLAVKGADVIDARRCSWPHRATMRKWRSLRSMLLYIARHRSKGHLKVVQALYWQLRAPT
jgi:ankyrin repeat protein